MWIYLIIFVILLILFLRIDCDFILYFYSIFQKNLDVYDGKTAWVIGSSSGIGKGIALKLAKLNCKLALTSTKKDDLERVKKEILEQQGTKISEDDILLCPLDITNYENLEIEFKNIVKKFGNIDFLMNNAGRVYFSEFCNDNRESNESIMKINFLANIDITRMVINFWKKTNQKGQIVVTSSIAAYNQIPFCHIYGASKRALNFMYDIIRFEEDFPITIICPGPVESEIFEKSFIEKKDRGEHKLKMMMPTNRCADLMLVSVANQFRESWISKQPFLLITWFFKLCPITANRFFGLILTKKNLEKLYKNIFK